MAQQSGLGLWRDALAIIEAMHHQPQATIALQLQHQALDTPTLLRGSVQKDLARKIPDFESG